MIFPRLRKILRSLFYILQKYVMMTVIFGEVIKMAKKSGTHSAEDKALREILKGIRTVDDRDNEECSKNITSSLGCNRKLSATEVNALFIKAAKEKFGAYEARRDIVLMALGLLKDYDYHKVETITERRDQYLRESNYLDGEYPYPDINNEKKKYQRRLETAEDKWLLELATFLNSQDIEEYLKDIDGYIDNGKPILPALSCATRRRLCGRTLTAIIKNPFWDKQVRATNCKKKVNENNECVAVINLTKPMGMASLSFFILLCAVLSWGMVNSIRSYQLQAAKNNSAVVAAAPLKCDHTNVPIGKEDLPDIGD